MRHGDFIPAAYLPTFNASTIGLNIHRINDLSEQFVYFNDDIFLLDSTSQADFFHEGMPCDIAAYSPLLPDPQLITKMIYNNTAIINEYHEKHRATVFRLSNLVHMSLRQLLASTLMAPFGGYS